MVGLRKDVAYAVRMLLRHRSFTLLAVVVLAVGIGANAAIFSFVHATSLRPLPFEEPDRLVLVSGTIAREEVELRAASYPEYRDWIEQSETVSEMAAFALGEANLTGGEEAERVPVSFVTPSYFSTFRVTPEGGRTFGPEDDAPPSGLPVAILSHRLWRERFGSDPGAVGSRVELDGRRLRIVGVLPPGFRGLNGDRDVWVPLRHSVELSDERSAEDFEDRTARWLQVLGRLQPTRSIEAAQAELDTVADRLRLQYPDAHEDRGIAVLSVEETLLGDVRETSTLLFVAVGFVWLIACTNVVSLLLVRMERRKKEIAIRSSVGARRGWILRQVMIETILLSLIGAAVGLVVAQWGTGLVTALSPFQLPEYVDVNVDLVVFAFIFVLALLTGTVLGVAPVLRVFRSDLTRTLKEGGEGVVSGLGLRRVRPQSLLVAAQVGVALLVLIGAAMVTRSFAEQRSLDPGFEARQVMTFRIQLPTVSYPPERAAAFVRLLEGRLAAVPGVESVGLTTDMLFDAGYSAAYATTEERYNRDPEDRVRMYYHRVNADFFATAGIPFLRGRTFESTSGDEAARDVVISRQLAERLWPGENPVGETLVIVRPPGFRIVGVVDDVRYRNLVPDPELVSEDPDVYLPILGSAPQTLAVLLKTSPEPETVLPAAEAAVHELDPNLPVFLPMPLADLLANETALPRLSSTLFGLFGLAALVLAVVGIYGVMAYSVSQRKQELGIRMALGAESERIRRQMLGEGLRIILLGLLPGSLVVLVSRSLFDSFLFRIDEVDPLTFLAVAAGLLVVGLLASLVPAHRASRIPPLTSLKDV